MSPLTCVSDLQRPPCLSFASSLIKNCHLGCELGQNASPAFAEVIRSRLRLLLAGPNYSAGRPMPDGRTPQPGGWNRIHFIVEDITAEVERPQDAEVSFPNEIISGPGGRQVLLADPSGNPV